jgi:hypothetical protein
MRFLSESELDSMLADGLTGPEATVIIAFLVLVGWVMWLFFRD